MENDYSRTPKKLISDDKNSGGSLLKGRGGKGERVKIAYVKPAKAY